MYKSFFSRIDGLFGERLATAVLATILERSRDVSTAFIGEISRRSQKPMNASNLKVTLEEHTESSLGNGNIDLLLTTDDSAIGIECKIWARLEKNQPRKYLEAVKKRAATYLLVVVVLPVGRNIAAATMAQQGEINGVSLLLTWREVVTILREARTSDAACNYLIEELDCFVNDYAITLCGLKSDYNFIFGAHSTSEYRIKYLDALLPFFQIDESPTRKDARNPNWHGVTFIKNKAAIEGWYGFVNARAIVGEIKCVDDWLFVIGLSKHTIATSAFAPSAPFRPTGGIVGWNGDFWCAWKYAPGCDDFASPGHWDQISAPFKDAIKKALKSVGSSVGE